MVKVQYSVFETGEWLSAKLAIAQHVIRLATSALELESFKSADVTIANFATGPPWHKMDQGELSKGYQIDNLRICS